MIGLFQKEVVEPVRDFVFASSCFYCGKRLRDGERRLCCDCWNSLSKTHETDYTVQVLRKRFDEKGFVDEFVSLFYFEKGKVLQSMAHSLKYEEVTSFGVELGTRVGEKLQHQNIQADAVIPIPLNKRKERERGFNQSEFLAKGIARVKNIPVLSDTVKRIKYTVTQTHLNAAERKENIADAFAVVNSEKIKGMTIILVDDIITTGSTIQETARVLKENGAKKIIAASAGLAKLGEDT
jgi:ComF family protein